ncbi:relaxase/mobilization nuclease domain-containing protein [Xanthomonas arboricola]|uniref:relaxase/mobilization nuclease domain-containing protein n=1 Tax=Xanthomonas arboricola TaxID=56448 RepID=UPI00118745E6|nr:relaxase/mobilization nuclease domain-containing protein [Xanthomonas arboricola]
MSTPKKPDELRIGPGQARGGRASRLPRFGSNPKKKPPSHEGAMRVARRAPEVVVSITGKTMGLRHMTSHLEYIHREGNLEGETSDGSLVIGRDEVQSLAKEWFARRQSGPSGRQNRSKDTVNVVFSMPEGTPRLAVTDATKVAAKRLFGDRFDYVMVTHTDTPNPHVHVTVLARGNNGERLNPGPDDLQTWREVFAQALREQAVEAEATSREMRGVVPKSVKNSIYHILKRGGESTIRVEELREAIAVVTGQVAAGERPWESASRKRQASTRSGWLEYAAALDTVGDPYSTTDAAAIRSFVAHMPAPVTRREKVEDAVREQLARQHDVVVPQAEERAVSRSEVER